MKQLRIDIPFYPFMAATVPVLLYFNTQAVTEVPADALLLPCAAVLATTCIIYALPCIVLRLAKPLSELDKQNPTDVAFDWIQIWALWSALAWMMLFSLSFCIELNGLCTAFNLPFNPLPIMPALLPYVFLLLIALAMIPIFARRSLAGVSSTISHLFTLFLLMQIGATAWYFTRAEFMIKPKTEAIQQAEILNITPRNITPRNITLSSANPPDIYYIILDEMASSDVLAQYVNYDDAWFRKALDERGFFVTRNSRSNYPLTRLSLSSSLNMIYLDKFADVTGANSPDLTTTAVLMRNHTVGKVLKKNNYEYIHIDSSVPPSNGSDISDRLIHCGYLDQFSERLIRSTLLALSPQAMATLRQHTRETILQQFAASCQIAAETPHSKSLFVFNHILCPHEPFLFDADGKPVFNEGSRLHSHWSKDTIAAYAAQAKFAQTKTIATIDSILSASRQHGRKPLIIIQGDHGTHCSDYVSSSKPSTDLLHERFGILNAYLVPDEIRSQLTDQTAPVNSFRIVLRTLFDLNLPNLEEKQIYATYERPFAFKDVSSQVQQQNPKIVRKN